MEFSVLGPIEVRRPPEPISLASARGRTLLALLLLAEGRVVTTDQAIEALWPDSLPKYPKQSLQIVVSRLRSALGPDAWTVIETAPGGYVLRLQPEDTLDLRTFRELVDQSAAADPATAAAMLSEAVRLWRGTPLAGLPASPPIDEHAIRLENQQLDAVEKLLDARLALGQHDTVLAELGVLTRQHPLRERFWAQLMRAQYRSGRRADALATYTAAYQVLADELGLEPGPELQDLQQAILTSSRSLLLDGSRIGDWVLERQLPLEHPSFVGRAAPTKELLAVLLDRTTVPIAVVCGGPGVGKSALAVRVAHALQAEFPDGQWYRSVGPASAPARAVDVLGELLRASGVDATAIPDGPAERAAQLRARLAGRRVLLVLDDAVDAEQIRPLLPGSPGCAVLITSRRQLAGLTVTDGAHTVDLDVLDPDEARSLLEVVLGRAAVDASPKAAARLVELCGALPLALQIAAANLARRPGPDLAGYVARLAAGDRLGQLAISGDPETAVAAAFAESYQELDDGRQRALRLLSQHPGPEFGRAAATALLGADAGPDLDGLATAGLLQRRADDRYQFHELLRVYATELAATDPERDAAAARLFDWYQRMTACVDRRWLDAERVNLIAAINQGRHPHAWQLADHLRDYLETELHVSDLQTACTAGLQAAVDAADLAGQAAMHSGLAIVGYYVGEMPDSIAHDQAALDLYRQAGSREGEAQSLGQLGIDALLTGDVRAGAAYLEECLAILDDLGAHQLRTAPLVNLAIARLEQGRPAEAARLCTSELASSTRAARYGVRLRLARVEALRQLRRYDDAAAVLAIVAAAVDADSRPMHQQLVATATAQLQGERGDLDYAEHQARTAVELATRTRHPWEECRARNILGDTLLRRGQLRPAAEAHDEAYRLAERNGYRGAQAEALVGLARAERDPATAARYADRALDLVAELGLRALERRAAEARDAIGASVDAALG